MDDKLYQELLDYFAHNKIPDHASTKSNWRAFAAKFDVATTAKDEKILHRKFDEGETTRIVLKKRDLDRVWNEVHVTSHVGRDKTYQMFCARFWFDGMFKWVAEKVKQCTACVQKRKTTNQPRAPLQPIPVASGIMSRVHVDITGGFVDVTSFLF